MNKSVATRYFDDMFAASDDPWAFRTRWYEARKRALTLASLPEVRYRSAYEPGCANGELSAALAERCDALLVSDGADKAVDLARYRLASVPHVTVVKAWLPEEWPASASFDLIVLSELGYFFDAAALGTLAQKALRSLRPGGTVLACHWRRPIRGCSLTGDAVHELLDAGFGLPRLSQNIDADLRLDVWCTDDSSVGTREGLVS